MEFMVSDAAVIIATLLGPVLAVQIQKFLERRREEMDRRHRIFKTLMATRASRLSPDHVQALNLIDLEFPPDLKSFKRVRSAWKAYHSHLGEAIPESNQQPMFYSRRQDLFEDMLYEMASALNYDFDKTQIRKDGYYPDGHGKMDEDALTIRTKLAEILSGKAAIPMAVVHFPSDPEFVTAQADYLKLMTEQFKSGKSWPVSIVSREAGNAPVQMDCPNEESTILPKS